jgi:hypothetical protein
MLQIGPCGFEDPYKYYVTPETNETVGVMHRMLNSISLPGDEPPELRDEILLHSIVTSQIENYWLQNWSDTEAVWVYVASKGVSRDYPGTNLTKE